MWAIKRRERLCINSRRFQITMIALLVILAVSSSFGRKAQADPWKRLENYGICAVAWSPDAKHIAMIVSDVNGFENMPCRNGVCPGESIWLMSWSKPGNKVEIKRMFTERDGHAIGLFWIDSRHVGWVRAGGKSFAFRQMGIFDTKSKALVDRSFYSKPFGNSFDTSAPRDVYFDAESHTIFFSGDYDDQRAYVQMLSLSTKKSRELSITYSKTNKPTWNRVSALTLCGLVHNPGKPLFYIAATVDMDGGETYRIWRSDSYLLVQNRVIETDGAYTLFPRISPNGGLLACVLDYRLAVIDLNTGKRRTLSDQNMMDDPMPGSCWFSWSPDGKRIACANGARIKIIKVTKP